MRWRLTEFIIDRPAQPVARLLLAHGAGTGSNSGFMQMLAQQLCAEQIEVWRFNFAYMQRFMATGKRNLPDRMPVLLAGYEAALAQCPTDLPLFIAGKSMGGRVASMLGEHSKVRAVFAFGYPFHAPKKNQWRTEHFSSLNRPLYILQGGRDAFGNRQELENMTWPEVRLYWLPDADHDFKPRVKSGLTQQDLITQAAQYCRRAIDERIAAGQ